MTRLYSNNFSTTLNGAITGSDTSITVTSASGLPSIGGGDTCQLTIQDGSTVEIVQATAVSGNVITVVRAQEGTTASAFDSLVTIELRATAASYIDKAGTVEFSGPTTLSDAVTLSGTVDASTSTEFKIPVSATPTLNSDGEIAVDTTVADFSHGVIKAYATEELGIVTMPIAQFTAPTDGYVVTYNATNDEFELAEGGGGGGLANVVDDTTPQLGGDLDGQANKIYFTGGSTSSYHMTTDSGSNPFYIQAFNNLYRFSAKSDGFLTTFGSGNSANFNVTTGAVFTLGSTSILDMTSAGARFGTGARITTVLDEDTMSTDSATALATQQSIKAYVDNNAVTQDWELIATATASSSASIEFTSLSSTYFKYVIVYNKVTPATNAVGLIVQTSTDNGSTYDNGASDYSFYRAGGTQKTTASLAAAGDETSSSIIIMTGLSNTAPVGTSSGHVNIYNPSDTTYTKMDGTTSGGAGSDTVTLTWGGTRLSAADVDAVRILFTSGNIATGDFRLYGLRAS